MMSKPWPLRASSLEDLRTPCQILEHLPLKGHLRFFIFARHPKLPFLKFQVTWLNTLAEIPETYTQRWRNINRS